MKKEKDKAKCGQLITSAADLDRLAAKGTNFLPQTFNTRKERNSHYGFRNSRNLSCAFDNSRKRKHNDDDFAFWAFEMLTLGEELRRLDYE